MLLDRLRSRFQRALTTVLACGVVSTPALATWSIVVIDTSTREVVVAAATCIPDFQLYGPLACVAVGKGGGASQSFILHEAKSIMFAGLQANKTPDQIMADIFATNSAIETRQFGIVGLEGPAASFTGNQDGLAALGVTGQVGTLRYAIQGNVLAQDLVVHAAEEALRNSEGDLGQRVMLAMEAATAFGGDGRCSCANHMPPCGQPTNFRRASATTFMIIARLGDTDSTTCAVSNNDCSNGDYYALLRKKSNFNEIDPVEVLRRKFQRWRQDLRGRPDHYETEVYQTAQVLQADGFDSTIVDISLMDVDGMPLVVGGQTIVVTAVDGPAVNVSAVTDNGDGTHQFTVTSGAQTGTTHLRIVVQDGIRDVQLYPDLEVQQAAPSELFADQHTLSAATGALVEFAIDSPGQAGRPYHLLGSASGTSPGTPFGGLQLPLNSDRLLTITTNRANSALLPSSMGLLDGSGAGTAYMDAPPGGLADWVGGHFDFVVYQAPAGGLGARVTNLVGFDITP